MIKAHDREYHVVFHDARWWVERDDGRSNHASADRMDAIHWAIRAAEQDHHDGLDVIVCVEKQDGSYRAVWSSPR